VISAFIAVSLLLGQHQQHQHRPGHSFEDIDRWVAEFESPERDRQQKPDEVVAALKLRSSDRIADIGAGTGYFSRRFAKTAGGGTVYAVDLEPNMLRYIARRALAEGQKNIVPVLALPDSPMLPRASVDVIFICNTIHHIENRAAYYQILRESLAPGGRLAIVDFRKDAALEAGPPLEMRLDRKELERELSEAGFRLVEEHDFLSDQYFVVYSVAE
jgi:ubiquinone/menaquinone biosynthesis C-methylase UbiE